MNDIRIDDDKVSTPKQGEHADTDVGGLASTLYFYKQLKYRICVRKDEKSQWYYRFHKKYLSRIKLVVLFIYILVLPFLETPSWCINKHKDDSKWERKSFKSLNCEHFGIPYSKNPTLSPITIVMMEFICIGFIGFFRWFKTLWGTTRRDHWMTNIVLGLAMTTVIVDNIVSIFVFRRAFLANLMRPIIFGQFLHLVRLNAR